MLFPLADGVFHAALKDVNDVEIIGQRMADSLGPLFLGMAYSDYLNVSLANHIIAFWGARSRIPLWMPVEDPAFDGVKDPDLADLHYAVTVHDLVVDPDDPRVVFAFTDERGLWRSKDGGAHWTEVMYPGSVGLYTGKVRKGGNGTLYYFANGNGFLASKDGGVKWERIATVGRERSVIQLVPDPILPDRVWLGMAATETPGSDEALILVSDDAGLTWRGAALQLLSLSDRASVSGLAICPADPLKMAVALYSRFEGGVFLSEDRGETWRNAGEPIDKEGGAAVAYAPLPDRCVLYASEVSDHSTWWTDDHGQQWHWMGRETLYAFAFNSSLPEMVFAIEVGTTDGLLFELWARK